jgi:hypothetical protein
LNSIGVVASFVDAKAHLVSGNFASGNPFAPLVSMRAFPPVSKFLER